MTCISNNRPDISIQIGVVFYDLFSMPSIRHATGQAGNTASFQVSAKNLPPPKNGKHVSIVFTYADGTQEKLFGGKVSRAKPIQFVPFRVYDVSCVDYTVPYTRKQSFSYDSKPPNSNVTGEEIIEFHLEIMFDKAGVKRPASFTRQLLDYIILRPAIEMALPEGAPDPTRQRFQVQNVFLDQALTLLCGQFGYRWRVDFGTWLRVDNLVGVQNIANVILTRNDFADVTLPFTIRPDGGGTCEDRAQWLNISNDFQYNDVNRVEVANDAESMEIALPIDPEQRPNIIPLDVADDRTIFRLLNKTNEVKKFVLIPN